MVPSDNYRTMRVVGQGVLPSPVRSFAWSPTVDLCVFVMTKEVSAHRFTGQKVWTINSNSLHARDLEFTDVAWRDDGTVPRIVSHEKGKYSLRVWMMDQSTSGMYKMVAKFVKSCSIHYRKVQSRVWIGLERI